MRIIGQIFEENNYDVFLKLDDNRDLLSMRLNKLIASISERYILNPIIVNEKMEIIDGQGRYEARKALNMPIHYIVAPGATSDDCRRMNKYNTRWTSLDFAKSYAKAGKKAYQLLLLACQASGYAIVRTLRLANHSTGTKMSSREYAMSAFERGDLDFSENDFDMIMKLKIMIDEIIEALQFTGRVNEAFMTGCKVAIETYGYDHDRMIKNCRRCRSSYTQMSSLSDQLVEFERIYNYNIRPQNKLYFSDYMRNKGSNVRSYEAKTNQYTDKDVSSLRRKDS